MEVTSKQSAFPGLTAEELDVVRESGTRLTLQEGKFAFRAGDADIDFFVVEEGALRIINPTNENAAFVFIGAEPHSQWLPDTIARDDSGYVLVGPAAHRSGRWTLEREPVPLETTLPRVLAAGDVRCVSTKRVAFAVDDTALAVTCVHRLRALR